MRNVSSEWIEKVNSGEDVAYLKYIDFELVDGTKLSVDNSDLWSNGFKFNDTVTQSDSFDIGTAIVNSATVTLNNFDDKFTDYVFEGARVVCYIGLQLADETIEKIRICTMTVTDAPYQNSVLIDLTLEDNMRKFDKDYSESKLSYPATRSQIVRDICDICDVTLASTTFYRDDYIVQTRPGDDSLTCRQVLSWVAMLGCQWARCNAQGQLVLGWYNTEPSNSDYVEIDTTSGLTVNLEDVVITGVRVTEYSDTTSTEDTQSGTYLEGDEGYVIEISDNKLIGIGEGQTAASIIGAKVIGMKFRPLSASILTDVRLEAGDPIKVTSSKGVTYTTYITSLTLQPGTYESISNNAKNATRNSSKQYSQMTQVAVEARKNVIAEKNAREQAIDALNKTLNESSGMYVTEETQPDGSTITYLHDKKSLSDSTNIIKITSDAIGISNNGGKTYPYGIELDGTFIANQLYSVGVNANYINTGALTIKDSDGNIIFSADVDTGTVYISGDNVTIGGGKTLNDALEEFSENAKNLTISLSNDYQAIGVDSDGNYDTFPDCSTTVTVMYGSLNVSNACTYSYLTSDSITGEWNGSTRTYTVKGLSADTGWVDITATYNTALKVTKRFSVGKVYDGADGQVYMLDSDISVFKTDRDGTKLSVKSVTFSAYKQNPDGSREPYSGRFVIKAIGKNYTQMIYTSSADESEILEYLDTGLATKGVSQYISGWKYWGAEPLADADGSILLTDNVLSAYSQDVESIQCELYAAGGTTTLIDKMLINRVIDVSLLDQEDVYNLLTNNGKWQGIYKNSDGNMYINFSYAHGGTLNLGGQNNTNGSLTVYDASGNQVGYWNKDGINATKGTFSGDLNAAGGTFNGDISAAGGTFKGNVRVTGTGSTYSDYYIEMNNGGGNTSPYLVMAYQDDETIFIPDPDDENVDFSTDEISLTSDSEPEIIAQLDGVNGLVANKGSFKGTINATSGSFNGTLTAIDGNIGGWNISSDSMKSSSGGMILKKNGLITNGNTELSFNTYSLEIDGGLYVNVKYNSKSGFVSDGGGINFNGLQTGTIAYQLGMLSGHIAVCRSSSSSKRYKDIERDMTFDDVESLFNIQPVMAKYKDGYLVSGDQLEGKVIPMFIAENVEEHFPEAVLYDDGQVEDWNYRVMIPAMFQMIKSQKNTIDSLTERIENLEALIQKGEN